MIFIYLSPIHQKISHRSRKQSTNNNINVNAKIKASSVHGTIPKRHFTLIDICRYPLHHSCLNTTTKYHIDIILAPNL